MPEDCFSVLTTSISLVTQFDPSAPSFLSSCCIVLFPEKIFGSPEMKLPAIRAASKKELTRILLASMQRPTPKRIFPMGPDKISVFSFSSIFPPKQLVKPESFFMILTTSARMDIASSFSCCVNPALSNRVTRFGFASSRSPVVNMYSIMCAFFRPSVRAPARIDMALPELSFSTALMFLAIDAAVGAARRSALSSFMGMPTRTSFKPSSADATTSRPPWNVASAWRMAKCETSLTVDGIEIE